ncbi:MAG: hypothetical protein J7M03_01700, partial [Candidatus Desulfofervidaceae bacterium]|nr:hypothetical protein [Candidatus Desulfofervidaceae bacterium]
MWIRLITGLLVIFFAGRRYPLYGRLFLGMSNLKTEWSRTLIWHIINAFPECCVILLSITVTHNAALSLGGILGAVLLNFFILACFLLFKKEHENSTQVNIFPTLLIAAFSLLLSLSLWLKTGAGFLNVGWASIFMLAGYIVYLKFLPLKTEEISQETDLEITPFILSLRFFVASLLIFAGAGQLVYSCKEIIAYFQLPSTLVGALVLGPVACLPKYSSLFTQNKTASFQVKSILVANIFTLGLLTFMVDFFYLQATVYTQATQAQFYLSLAVLSLSLCTLGIFLWTKYKKILSGIIILGYLTSI